MEEKDELRDFYIVLSLDFALLHYSYYYAGNSFFVVYNLRILCMFLVRVCM